MLKKGRCKFNVFFIFLSCIFINVEANNLNINTYAKKYTDYVDVYVVNNNSCDMSITFNATYKNLKPLNKFPITESYKPFTTTKILRFMKVNKNKKWKYHIDYKYRHGKLNQRHNNNYSYRLPYKLGTVQKISQGNNTKLTHKGQSKYAIDFKMDIGTKIYAAREGVVIFEKEDSNVGGISKKKFYKKANHIGIEHSDGTIALYSHLKKNGSTVKVGDKVFRGDLIGYSGNTGFTSGPHLHFIVYTNINGNEMKSLPIRFLTNKGILSKLKKGDKFYAVK